MASLMQALMCYFSFELRGKRRSPKKPRADETRARPPRLEAEIAALHPDLVVCPGATAAQAILGPGFRVTRSRGMVLSSPIAPRVMATVHPSSILRAPDQVSRRAEDGVVHCRSALRSAR